MTATLVHFICIECVRSFDIAVHEHAPVCPICGGDTLIEHERLGNLTHFSPEHRPRATSFIFQHGQYRLDEIVRNAKHLVTDADARIAEAALPDALRTLTAYEKSILQFFTEADARLVEAGLREAAPSIAERSQAHRDAYAATIAAFGPQWRTNVEAVILLAMISYEYEAGIEYAVMKYQDWASD